MLFMVIERFKNRNATPIYTHVGPHDIDFLGPC
jgi:hypothetical protein